MSESKKDPDFNGLIELLRHGEVRDELNAHLGEAIAATKSTLKVSTVTIKLTIKANGIDSYRIIDDIKSTLPKHDKNPTIVFPDVSGQLVRDDPRQRKLDLQQVEPKSQADVIPLPTKAPLRSVGH